MSKYYINACDEVRSRWNKQCEWMRRWSIRSQRYLHAGSITYVHREEEAEANRIFDRLIIKHRVRQIENKQKFKQIWVADKTPYFSKVIKRWKRMYGERLELRRKENRIYAEIAKEPEIYEEQMLRFRSNKK